MTLFNVCWWQECRRKGIPCVVVKSRRRYVTVAMDMATIDYELSRQGLEEAKKALQRYSAKRAWIFLSAGYVDSTQVSIEHAEKLARELLRIGTEFRQPFTCGLR